MRVLKECCVIESTEDTRQLTTMRGSWQQVRERQQQRWWAAAWQPTKMISDKLLKPIIFLWFSRERSAIANGDKEIDWLSFFFCFFIYIFLIAKSVFWEYWKYSRDNFVIPKNRVMIPSPPPKITNPIKPHNQFKICIDPMQLIPIPKFNLTCKQFIHSVFHSNLINTKFV